jgi:hypothetical protein
MEMWLLCVLLVCAKMLVCPSDEIEVAGLFVTHFNFLPSFFP